MKTAYYVVLAAIVVLAAAGIFYYAGGMGMHGAATGETGEASYIDVSAAEAKQLIDSNPDLVIIDVSPVYDQGHIPGAVNYYVGDGSLDAAIPGLDKEATYLVYCHVDSASILGAQKLVDAGFTKVYRLRDHYGGWVAAGYPVEM
jgi:rhodanese-related sulfurtransferase